MQLSHRHPFLRQDMDVKLKKPPSTCPGSVFVLQLSRPVSRAIQE